jgi:hypothetical protein
MKENNYLEETEATHFKIFILVDKNTFNETERDVNDFN